MTTLTRACAAALVVAVLAGCSWGGGGAVDRRADPQPEVAQPTTRPHFEGARGVSLVTGRAVYGDQSCPAQPESDRVCDATDGREYLVLDRPAPAQLVEARMDLADGHTSWTVTVTFSRESARVLTGRRELARESGAVVLVLGGTGEVLLAAAVTRIEGRRITYPLLAKPEAWELVEQVAGS